MRRGWSSGACGLQIAGALLEGHVNHAKSCLSGGFRGGNGSGDRVPRPQLPARSLIS